MRVLHLIDSAGLYGAEQVVLALAGKQRELGWDAMLGSVAAPNAPSKAIELESQSRGVPVERITVEPGMRPRAIRQLHSAINPLRPDIIHSHGYKTDVLLALLPYFERCAPIVATIHGWTSTSRFSKNALYEWLDRLALHRFERVVAVGNATSNFSPFPWIRSASVIPNGITPFVEDEQSVDDEFQTLSQFCTRKPTLLMVGRLSPEKNQEIAIRAVSSLRDDGMDIQLIIAGEGRLRRQLQDLIDGLRVGELVRMPGYIKGVHRLFPSCPALLVTSVTEGMPICILEAVRARLSVISTSVGDVPRMLCNGDGGWLVPVNDLSALKKSIRECIEDRFERDHRSSKAFEKFLLRFTTTSMARGYEEIYMQARERFLADRRHS